MRAHFRSDSVTLTLDPAEFGFVFRAVNDRIHSLTAEEVGSRLGMPYKDAVGLLDAILAAEKLARTDGDHWLPQRPTE